MMAWIHENGVLDPGDLNWRCTRTRKDYENSQFLGHMLPNTHIRPTFLQYFSISHEFQNATV